MKRITILFLLAFTAFLGEAKASMGDWIKSFWSEPVAFPAIKILILHDQPAANLEVIGKYTLEDPHANKHLSTRHVGKSQMMQAIPAGLKWGEEFPGIHQIQITPTGPDTVILINGIEYKGKMQVYNIGRTISVVNELPVELYLSYLLPKKYSP